MKLLLLNPNTTHDITLRLAHAAATALPGVEILPATGRFGPSYISSRIGFAVAQHAALAAFAEHGASCDAVLLACFGDPGLDALREVARAPVVSLIDAACAEAGSEGRRFSIVTGGERWGPMLEDALRLRGLDEKLASICTVAPSGGDIAHDPESATSVLIDACRTCLADDGAEAVILGGAGLLGLAARLQPYFDAPIICSVEAGFRATAALRATTHETGQSLPDPVPTIGLSPELAALFEKR